jgi:hypothetical protein
MMAVLGAKRPQHGAWQFIVLSLAGVLALPALEYLVLQGGETLAIDGVRSAFLAGLIALGLLNWLPTRRWPTALFVAGGQIALYAEHLPWIVPWECAPAVSLAAISFVVATAIAVVQDHIPRRDPAAGFDRVWRDFRDDYGALWALRVAERVNAAATKSGSSVRLTWRGFRTEAGAAPSRDDVLALETSLENLLRRFVSREWIAKRGEKAVH